MSVNVRLDRPFTNLQFKATLLVIIVMFCCGNKTMFGKMVFRGGGWLNRSYLQGGHVSVYIFENWNIKWRTSYFWRHPCWKQDHIKTVKSEGDYLSHNNCIVLCNCMVFAHGLTNQKHINNSQPTKTTSMWELFNMSTSTVKLHRLISSIPNQSNISSKPIWMHPQWKQRQVELLC